MAHIDKLKEEIGWLKIVFAILIATAISLAAWVIQNYGEANRVLTIGGAAAVLLIITIIIRINSVAYQKIDKLEDL
ncbi:MAG: hypothetical protein OXI63_19925 [Candidatus Poribacteria bacterium]|nr:hypothetical protein [Candidatus Poribacteria bacterium]MDE0685201.1 hypothetical protein [Candidatus Poribacteria bacterium]